MLLTGRWLDGAEAVAWGIALESVPRADLERAVEAFVTPFRDKPRSVLGAIERAMEAGAGSPIDLAVGTEIDVMLEHVKSAWWGREGFDAFREGWTPRWK